MDVPEHLEPSTSSVSLDSETSSHGRAGTFGAFYKFSFTR